jgi:hypothetical protein
MRTHIYCPLALGLMGALLLPGCRESTVRALPASPDSVRFRIQAEPLGPAVDQNARAWLATYNADGKTARFRVHLVLKAPREKYMPAFSSGAFYRVPRSDSAALLRDLARVLGARKPPTAARKEEKLPFRAAILGQNLSRAEGATVVAASFTYQPKGTWIATKVFVGDGDAEFFLNLDPPGGVGEISVKDSDYGDQVFQELSKVL